MARMRTIDQAVAVIREADPESALTKTALRRMVISGELPAVRVGTKYLVDLDRLEAFLTAGTPSKAPAATSGIRRINAGR